MARGHDQPDPALIVEGSRRHQPSKRVQGEDYPVSALEVLQKRDRGTYCGTHELKLLTSCKVFQRNLRRHQRVLVKTYLVILLVIESPVRSGYLPFLALTETLTGYTKSQISKKPDLTDTNRSGAVFFG